jgi:hypothetical protein
VSFLDLAKCRGDVALPEKKLRTPRRRTPGLARAQHNTAAELEELAREFPDIEMDLTFEVEL